MKIFAFILSIYILALTAVPCIDVAQDNTLPKVELTKNTNDTHQNDFDHCSPFCSCLCCASPIIYQSSSTLRNFAMAQKIRLEYKSDFFSSIIASIWQPPKLS